MSKHPREIVESFDEKFYPIDMPDKTKNEFESGKFWGRKECLEEVRKFFINSHIEILEQEIEFLESQFEMAKSTKQFVDKCRWNDCLNAQISHLQQQLSEWRLMK